MNCLCGPLNCEYWHCRTLKSCLLNRNKVKTVRLVVKRKVKSRGLNKRVSSVLKKQNPWCLFCGIDNNLTIDHIKPKSKGGTNDIENLQVLCKKCNEIKGSKYPFEKQDYIKHITKL